MKYTEIVTAFPTSGAYKDVCYEGGKASHSPDRRLDRTHRNRYTHLPRTNRYDIVTDSFFLTIFWLNGCRQFYGKIDFFILVVFC